MDSVLGLLQIWYSAGLSWDPKDFNNIRAITDASLAEMLAPDFHVPK